MTPAEAAEYHFLHLGMQYYVAARSAALAGLIPVCDNLFHHAIEMFLKARLSRAQSLKNLKDSLGHKLKPLWDTFKAEFRSAKLEEFDKLVDELAAFERIRYPDNVIAEGAAMHLDWGEGDSVGNDATTYRGVVSSVDRLVVRIFELSSKNPLFFTATLNPYARNALSPHNPVLDSLFKQAAANRE